jgi:hypothetical protein
MVAIHEFYVNDVIFSRRFEVEDLASVLSYKFVVKVKDFI